MSKPDIASLAPLVEKAVLVLPEWRAGFHTWLAVRGKGGEGKVGFRTEFGPWLGRLTQVLRVDGCEDVAGEARSWLAARWGRGLLKPSSFLGSAGHRAGCLTACEAASRLGVTTASVGRMIDAGEMRPRYAQWARTLRRVDPASVGRKLAEAVVTLNAEDAAARLGETVREVDAMERLGLMHPVRVLVEGRRVRRYGVRDIDAAADRLLATALPMNRNVGHCVKLLELPARAQVPFERITSAITTGAARCWRDGVDGEPAFHCVRLRLPKVAGASLSVPGKLSVREAAKALGLSTWMMPALVAAGCIWASPSRGARSGAIAKHGIDADSVTSFGFRYAMSRDIVAVHGTSTKVIIARLRAAGAEPLVKPNPRAGFRRFGRRPMLPHCQVGLPNKRHRIVRPMAG